MPILPVATTDRRVPTDVPRARALPAILAIVIVLAALAVGLTLALTGSDGATDPLPPGTLARGPDAFDALARGGIAHRQATGFARRNALLDADAAKGAAIPPEQFVEDWWARYDAAGVFREAILATFDAVRSEEVGARTAVTEIDFQEALRRRNRSPALPVPR